MPDCSTNCIRKTYQRKDDRGDDPVVYFYIIMIFIYSLSA